MMYLWAKWLHIIAIISWMAGLLYMFRLFVYHRERGHIPEVADLLETMERRVYKAIIIPAMMIAFIAGFSMVILLPSLATGGWFWVKMAAVLGLVGVSGFGGKMMRAFKEKQAEHWSSKQLRVLNEVPTILMLIIVGLVVFKAF